MRYIHYLYMVALVPLFLTACQDKDDLAGDHEVTPDNVIHVGGVSADELIARVARTRDGDDPVEEEEVVKRTDAEKIPWLVDPLKTGLYISYGDVDVPTDKKLAFLQLLSDETTQDNPQGIKYSSDELFPDGKVAEYSFTYLEDRTKNAQWLDNGGHFFEGQYVPPQILYSGDDVSAVNGENGSAPNLGSDQHDDSATGNYTLLSRYLAMPVDYTINATVARVKLPFRHRLAHVIAYILIDPDMAGAKIEGYSLTDGKDDPTSSKIKFCNVKVLAGVKDTQSGSLHTYTPQWTEVRKAIPHFVGERGSYNDSLSVSLDNDNFISYYDLEKKTYIDPTDAAWQTIKDRAGYFPESELQKVTSTDQKYERIKFGKVPVYDLIIQPTYTSLNRVMYDETGVDDPTTKQNLYVATNQIDFEVILDNGLHYTKSFAPLDLDANYQTVVYLHISRERVDYNSSGSQLWNQTIGSDNWYGVNNRNGNTLSIAGSGWQRAYTNNNTDYPVTDGHLYLHDGEDEKAQYVTDEKWIEMFLQAKEGGLHHGDYFILDHNIEIAASAIPADFVFTGHLDGMDHTITITGNDRNYLFDGLNGTYTTPQESDESATWEANVHKEGSKWVPTSGWRAEIINTKFIINGGTLFKEGASVTGYVNNCVLNDARTDDHTPSLPEY